VKRLFGLLLIFVICVTALSGTLVFASAEANDVELDFDVTRDGEEVVAIVTLMENDGIVDLYLRVEYDKDALVLMDTAFGSGLSALKHMDNFGEDGAEYEYPYRLEYLDYVQKNVDGTGRLVTLRFRVKDGAKDGEHSVKLVIRQVGYINASSEIVYNEKYGEELVFDLDSDDVLDSTTGGVAVAEKIVVTSKGSVVEIREAEQGSSAKKGLMIGLIVGGVVLFVAAGVVSFLFYRKKHTQTDNK